METTSAGGDRIIKRWDRCPGWDRLLDRADELVRRDTSRAGHNHWVQARSKNARIDFDASLQERFDYLCPELREALDAIEDESLQTCQECGSPGEERPSHYYSTLCVEHAQASLYGETQALLRAGDIEGLTAALRRDAGPIVAEVADGIPRTGRKEAKVTY